MISRLPFQKKLQLVSPSPRLIWTGERMMLTSSDWVISLQLSSEPEIVPLPFTLTIAPVSGLARPLGRSAASTTVETRPTTRTPRVPNMICLPRRQSDAEAAEIRRLARCLPHPNEPDDE